MTEQQIEQVLIEKMGDLKYTYRPDITARDLLACNFRKKFEALNRVNLMDELVPLLRKRAQGRDISGLNAYEQ